MEKREPITSEPVNPPAYNSKQEYEEKAEPYPTQQDTVNGVNVIQQTTQDQTAVHIVPQPMIAHPHATTNTGLCECDGPWWGLCCLSFWLFGIGSVVADRKLHGSVTGIGWGLLIMGVWRWVALALSICSTLDQFGVIEIPGALYWCGVILPTAFLVLRIILLHQQRRSFLNRQFLSGSYPNDEDCCCLCCTAFWCFYCNHGQIASAMHKQNSRVVPVQVV